MGNVLILEATDLKGEPYRKVFDREEELGEAFKRFLQAMSQCDSATLTWSR